MTPIYLALVLSVAVLGAFTDIHCGLVRNRHLLLALVLWLILAVSEFFVLHSSSIPVLPLALNALLAFAAAVVFYLTDIWAPGDCKLYIIISLLFPMRAYVVRKGNIFPALDFVIYAFALGYIFLFAAAISSKTTCTFSIKPVFSLHHVISVLTNAGTISSLNILLDTFAPEFFYANQMLCILASIAFICLLQKKAESFRKLIGFISLMYILVQSILRNTWLNTCLSMFISLILASAIEVISSRVHTNTYREISGDEIRPGMILSFVSLWAMRKCVDPELPHTTTENRRSRLTQKQADAVKTWCRKSGNTIVIVEMIPFAPFIAGAVVIEILRFMCLGR